MPVCSETSVKKTFQSRPSFIAQQAKFAKMLLVSDMILFHKPYLGFCNSEFKSYHCNILNLALVCLTKVGENFILPNFMKNVLLMVGVILCKENTVRFRFSFNKSQTNSF